MTVRYVFDTGALIGAEPLPLAAAKAAGMALAPMKERTDSRLSIDAAVMAFGALLDAPVVTSDLTDLERLRVPSPACGFSPPLRNGARDLAILVRPPVLPVETRTIYTERFVAVAFPNTLPVAPSPKKSCSPVRGSSSIMTSRCTRLGGGHRSDLAHPCQPAPVACRIASLDEMRALAEAGIGATVLPEYHVEEALRARRLLRLEPKRQDTSRARPSKNAISLIWRRAKSEAKRVRAVRESLLA